MTEKYMVRKLAQYQSQMWITYIKVDVSRWLIQDVGEDAASSMVCTIPRYIAVRDDMYDTQANVGRVSAQLRDVIKRWVPPANVWLWESREQLQFRPNQLQIYEDYLEAIRNAHGALTAWYAEHRKRPTVINACRAGVLSWRDDSDSTRFLIMLPHRMLQIICKSVGCPAAGTTEALMARLEPHARDIAADVQPYLKQCAAKDLRRLLSLLGIRDRGACSKRAATAHIHWHCTNRLAARVPLFNADLSQYIREFL